MRDAGAPVLLDGAQGVGAVPVDVRALGCDYYACSGQKWLCGPQGSGYLYVRADRIADLSPAAPGYGSLADPLKALELDLREGAARYDGGVPIAHHAAWALAALDVLEAPGLAAVHERAADLAARLAEALAAAGHTVAPRGRSTLVSWEAADPEADGGAAGGRGLRHPQPAGHVAGARLGGRVVLRGRARPAGRSGLGAYSLLVITTTPNTTLASTSGQRNAPSAPSRPIASTWRAVRGGRPRPGRRRRGRSRTRRSPRCRRRATVQITSSSSLQSTTGSASSHMPQPSAAVIAEPWASRRA